MHIDDCIHVVESATATTTGDSVACSLRNINSNMNLNMIVIVYNNTTQPTSTSGLAGPGRSHCIGGGSEELLIHCS